MLQLLVQLQQAHHMALILITHDLAVVAEVAQKVVVMYAGKVVEEATVDELFANPRHPYTQGLIRSIPRIDLAATHFAAKNPKAMTVANRTLERGEKLAGRFGAEVMRLADLPNRLHEFDAVISCTASTLPLIGLGAVERALKQRRHRPMFMVDLAVPRDIEPEVKALSDVYLYTVDDLAAVVQTAQANRQAAVAQAEVIIDAGVQSFLHWMDQRSSVPLIQQLNAQADEWRQAEMARARKLLAKGEDVDAVLEALSKGLTQKMLHGALAELHAGDATARERASAAIQHFFLRRER